MIIPEDVIAIKTASWPQIKPRFYRFDTGQTVFGKSHIGPRQAFRLIGRAVKDINAAAIGFPTLLRPVAESSISLLSTSKILLLKLIFIGAGGGVFFLPKYRQEGVNLLIRFELFQGLDFSGGRDILNLIK